MEFLGIDRKVTFILDRGFRNVEEKIKGNDIDVIMNKQLSVEGARKNI